MTFDSRSSEIPFRAVGLESRAMDGGLISAIESKNSIQIEVTFDSRQDDQETFLFVDLVDAKKQKRSHLSIRLSHSYVLLNTLENGAWGKDDGCKIDWSTLRFWRLWLTLSSDGMLELKLGQKTLCKIVANMRPEEVAFVEANISAIATLPVNETVTLESGVFDRNTINSSTVLMPLDQKLRDNLGKLKFFDQIDEVPILGSSEIVIGTETWIALKIAKTGASMLLLKLEQHEAQIYDNRSFPVVEVTSGYISVRSPLACGVGAVIWRQESGADVLEARSATLIHSDDLQPDLIYKRILLPTSALLRVLPTSRMARKFALHANGIQSGIYSLIVGPKIVLALDNLARNLLSQQAILDGQWQMIALDWCSVFLNADLRAILETEALNLSAFLLAQSEALGTGTPHVSLSSKTLNEEKIRGQEAPNSEAHILSRATHDIVNFLENSLMAADKVEDEILQRILVLPIGERNWLCLDLFDRLVERDVYRRVSLEFTRDFIEDAIGDAASVRRLSLVCAVIASRGQFEDCLAILARLVEHTKAGKGSEVSLPSLSCAMGLFARASLQPSLRENLFLSAMHLLEEIEACGAPAVCHAAIIEAFASLAIASSLGCSRLQDIITHFIERHFFFLPEFWDIFYAKASNSLRDSFAERIASIGSIALKEIEVVRGFVAHSANRPPNWNQGSSDPKAITTKRSLLSRFFSIHDQETNPLALNTTVIDGDSAIRLLALPDCLWPDRADFGRSRAVVRREIRGSQGFPLVPHHDLLETLGKAASTGDHNCIIRALPLLLNGELVSDVETESVVMDVVVWSITSNDCHELEVESLMVLAIKRLRSLGERDLMPPSMHSAIQRLLNTSRSGAHLATKQPERELSQLYQRRFASLTTLRHANVVKGERVHSQESFFSDTLIAVITCRRYLESRARECRETWVEDAESLGVTVLFFCGSGEDAKYADVDMASRLIYLPVGDLYEDLPAKVTQVFAWIEANMKHMYVIKIDDDCYLDAENYLTSLAYRRHHYFGRPLNAFPATFDRSWHQERSSRESNKRSLDTSLLGTRYADGGGSYALSRQALFSLMRNSESEYGTQLLLASFFEDKMIGDLLGKSNIQVFSEGYNTLQARRKFSSAHPVLQIDRTFYPGKLSGISVAHLDQFGVMKSLRDEKAHGRLLPSRIFPLNQSVSLSHDSNMLEILNPRGMAEKVRIAKVICVSVFRNEIAILPHFLDHYRRLGVDLFLSIDNLSDDGTREHLLQQEDVVVFSAASDYRDSRFGIDWQKTVLDHFCAGRWVIVADADEFLLTQGERPISILEQCAVLESKGFDASVIMMVDMYPLGSIDDVDFKRTAPKCAKMAFDSVPARRWKFNRGPFGNLSSYVSTLRHRIMPLSSPEMFTTQKIALFRYNPLMQFSEGFHFGTGMRWSSQPLVFLHYKYSVDFSNRSQIEARRGQHFQGALEYRKYSIMLDMGLRSFWSNECSQEFSFDGANLLDLVLLGVDRP